MQLKNTRLDEKYPFVYKFTGRVGPNSNWRQLTQMLFFNYFYFPIWFTDGPKNVTLETEVIVHVEKNATLSCKAEGNPPPTYTWTPCDPGKVCNKNTLDISPVLNDTSYTCRVTNVYGDESKTVNVCKSHVYCCHASNSCIFIDVPTWHFDWVLRVEPGVSLLGPKSPNSAFTLS